MIRHRNTLSLRRQTVQHCGTTSVMPSIKSLSSTLPGTLKWDGWGDEHNAFDPGDRPNIWPYVAQTLQIGPEWPLTPPVDPGIIELPPCRLDEDLRAALSQTFPDDRLSVDKFDRIIHAYGKSTRDLWRIRHGRIDFAPDIVVVPETEAEVIALLDLASRFGAVVIPFGGGTNVAGCLELYRPETRPVISANLRRMNRVLEIDTVSGFVRAEPGILGPDLERQLNAAGVTLGHFPDSFPYSTLGGWVATRSSGVMSDAYGNIEDMVVSLRMVTPTGVISTHCVPQASNGPDPNWLCIGSEGTLGIITELTMRVRPEPAVREFRGYLFPSFRSGLAALRECSDRGCMPALGRLNDPFKTQISVAFRSREGRFKRKLGQAYNFFLRRFRGFDFDRACLMVAAFQGDKAQVHRQRAAVQAVYRRHGGMGLGRGPGEAFAAAKYDFPFIRDFLMDHGVICDVADTSATWGRLKDLYDDGMAQIGAALGRDGRPTWLGCHVSHTYSLGASMYFSFAFRCDISPEGAYDPAAELAYYANVKKSSLVCFSKAGATLSHHHAVGYEHLPWLTGESRVGDGSMIEAVKTALDPERIMNPDKLVSGFRERDLDNLLTPPGHRTAG